MERQNDSWEMRLPESLHEHVVWAVRMEAHHDDGVPASKWRGYDSLGQLCYYRHRFSQRDVSFDDDDQPRSQLLRVEDFEAWRSHAGPWVRRLQRIDGDGQDDGIFSDSGFVLVSPQSIPRL